MIAKKSISKFKNKLDNLKIRKKELVEELENNFSFFSETNDNSSSVIKEDLNKIELEIKNIFNILNNNEIIDTSTISTDIINFGSVVTIMDLETEKIFTYQLLSSDEIDIDNGIISINSPMGKNLLNKKIEDEIIVNDNDFEIIKISKDLNY